MKKKEKQYKIKSPKGVEYELGETKAVAMVEKMKCTWVDAKPREKKVVSGESKPTE